MVCRFHLLVLSLLVASFSCAVQAHNGYVAVAQPVSGISIDGDLSDWPQEMQCFFLHMNRFVYISPQPKGTFQGRFRVGCNHSEHALYVAVEIEDDMVVFDADTDEWNSRDICDVFLIANHASKKASPRKFSYRAKPTALFQNQINEEQFKMMKVARTLNGNQLVYEWRFDLDALFNGPIDTSKGAVLGFDVAYFDFDLDSPHAYYSSSPGTHKHVYPEVLGDLVIAPLNGAVVELSGRVAWSSSGIPPATKLCLQSLTNKMTHFQIPLTPNGHFILPLPVGDYELTTEKSQPNAVASYPKRLTVNGSTSLAVPIEFELKNPEENTTENASAAVVYYDLAHGEHPLTKLREFGNKIGYSLRTSTEPISLDALANSKLLYLRVPTSRFFDSEKDAIVDFVENGGSLLLVMDEKRRTSVEKTEVNEMLAPFGIRLLEDTVYLHNCGAVAEKGVIHQKDLELPYSGGRAVQGGTPFGFQLDEAGDLSHPFATRWKGPNGGRIIVLGEAMASLFLGSLRGERLTGSPLNPTDTTYWGKDSEQFNVDLFTWLLEDRGD